MSCGINRGWWDSDRVCLKRESIRSWRSIRCRDFRLEVEGGDVTAHVMGGPHGSERGCGGLLDCTHARNRGGGRRVLAQWGWPLCSLFF